MKKNVFEEYSFTDFEVVVFEINESWDHDLMYSYDIIGYGADGIYVIERPDYISTVGNRSYRERDVIASGKTYNEILEERALLVGKTCNVTEFVGFFVMEYYEAALDEVPTAGLFAIRKDGRLQQVVKISDDFDQVWVRKALPNEGPEWFFANQFEREARLVYNSIRQAYVQLLASGQYVESM